MAEFSGFVSALGQTLAAAFEAPPSRSLIATTQHVLKFTTWADLEKEGLADEEKVALVLKWVLASTKGKAQRAPGLKR